MIFLTAVATPAPTDRDSLLSNIFGSQVPLVDDIPALKVPVNGLRASLGLPPVDDDGVVISPVDNNDDSGVFTSDSEEPAVSQEFSERRIESGSASPSSSFSNTGDNVNACSTTQQVVNTGNVANQQGVTQYNSTSDDISFEGSNITITPDQTSTRTQTIDQAAAGK